MLEMVFGVGPVIEPSHQQVLAIFGATANPASVAVLVGPRSEEAVRTLSLGLESKEPLEAIGYVFRDLEAAWEYVESGIS